MPVTVPLYVAASAFHARRFAGPAALLAIAAMEALVRTVKAHDAGRDLLTFEAPAALFPMTGKAFVSPLVFPTHFSALIERDVSHFSTLAEMQRVLASKPVVAVLADPIHNGPVNTETEALVRGYVSGNCRLIAKQTILERDQTIDLVVWGDCRPEPPRPSLD